MAIGDQSTQVNSMGLDLSHVSDAINRLQISDKRKRNEMIRAGVTDPNAFAISFGPQLQQAQQPTEFLGAGRKEIGTGDYKLASALGGTLSPDNRFYYGDFDLGKASWGSQDEDDINLGGGKYNIMQGGQSLGTGYKSLQDTIRELSPGTKSYGNYIKDYEVLGQLLNYGGAANISPTGGNKRDDPISGLDILYGSTPIIYDNKLYGYHTPNDDPVKDNWNVVTVKKSGNSLTGKKKTTRWDIGSSIMGRAYNDPEWWNAHTTPTGDGGWTITPENIESNPGWLNRDNFVRTTGKKTQGGGLFGALGQIAKFTDPFTYNALGGSDFYDTAGSEGLYSAVFDRLDPILDKIDPGHNKTQDALTGLLGNDTQKETFNQIAPIVLSLVGAGVGGITGQAISGVQGLNAAGQGDAAGAIMGALGASGYNPTGALADGIQSTTKMTPAMAKALANFGTSTAMNLARGQDTKSALASALFSSAAGGVGDKITSATTGSLGDIGARALGGAASGGLNSLFTKNSPIAGSLFGGISGGLHGYLNSIAKGTNTLDKKQDANNRISAQTLSNTLRKLTKRNGR